MDPSGFAIWDNDDPRINKTMDATGKLIHHLNYILVFATGFSWPGAEELSFKHSCKIITYSIDMNEYGILI